MSFVIIIVALLGECVHWTIFLKEKEKKKRWKAHACVGEYIARLRRTALSCFWSRDYHL